MSSPRPSRHKRGFRLLSLFLRSNEHDVLLGDFEEIYGELARTKGPRKAGRWYRSQVLRFFPAYIAHSIGWGAHMFGSYLRAGARNLRKHKVLSSINILGLAVGLAGSILIFLFVTDELAFDNFHARERSIYRVMAGFYREDGRLNQRSPSMAAAAAPLLKEFFPQIKRAVRFADERATVRTGDRLFNETVTFTDPGVFEVFSFPLRRGDAGSVLSRASSLVLTETAAAKYFGRADPLGKTMTLTFGTNARDFVVTGVAADTPRNSTIQFRFLIPIDNLTITGYQEALTNLSDFSHPLYIQLEDRADPETVESRLDAFLGSAYAAEFAHWGVDVEKLGRHTIRLDLQRLRDMHFDTTASDGSDPSAILIMAGIALIVLIIACMNYINLALGRAAVRTGEIGIRKVIGATRGQIIRQFLSESLILVGTAFISGLGMALVLMPVFNRLSGKALAPADLIRPDNVPGLAILFLVVTAVSGIYPALIMSGVRPVTALKGRTAVGGRPVVTKILVLIQFFLSAFLIISGLVLGRQARFLAEKNPGYIREGLVSVRLQAWRAEEAQPIVERFKNRAGTLPDVLGVTAANVSFGRGSSSFPLKKNGVVTDVCQFRVDPDYLRVVGLTIVQGRGFSPASEGNRGSAVINREFCRRFGLTDPLGRRISEFFEGKSSDYPLNLEIIGIVEDYSVLSHKKGPQPVLLQMEPGWGMNHMLVRLRTSGIIRAIKGLEAAWREVQPGKPFEYSFVQDDLEAQYASEAKWNSIIRYSTLFALVIACMGIFGLTTLAVNRRFKEIGIRKVLGAGAASIFTLVSREIVLLVASANLIAWPVVSIVMRRVLNDYYYRIPLKPSFYLAAAVLSLAAAVLTVGSLAVRASRLDPVKAIKYE